MTVTSWGFFAVDPVQKSMNISGALSTQTVTIGGKASGPFVDSGRFEVSDVNIQLQVDSHQSDPQAASIHSL